MNGVMERNEVNGVRKLESVLAEGFVGREEEAKVAVLALLCKQHAVFIGEPGTAKSALVHRLANLVNCRYYYYLLSKYTVPDEIVGAIDPVQYKSGKFVRNTKGKLPDTEIAFIDEVFKGSSETLNTLLNIMNERIFVDVDGTVYKCPLHSLYGASNELPSEDLSAFYDRFLLKHFVHRINVSAIERAIIHMLSNGNSVSPILTLKEIENIYAKVTEYMKQNMHAVAKVTAQLVLVLRQNGIFVSDRTAISPNHLPRLIATYSYVYGSDLKKSAITVSKYILPNEEAIEAYKKALDSLLPVEIREAQERLEKAKDLAINGDLQSAKRLSAEAIQLTQNLFSNPEKVEMFKEEIKDVMESAERLIKEINEIEEKLKSFKVRK